MHFVGENGVGKTLAAVSIAQGLFKTYSYVDKPEGLLYLHGQAFTSSEHVSIDATRAAIKEKVIEQLKKCPASVIVLDESELIHWRAISVFQEFLDYTVRVREDDGEAVILNKATYIFISDFVKSDITRDKTNAEITLMVKSEANKIWRDAKQHQLIDHVIPFFPKTRDGAHLMLDYLLEHVLRQHPTIVESKIIILEPDSVMLGKIANVIYDMAEDGANKDSNYRGIDRQFREVVLAKLIGEVEKDGRSGETVEIIAKNKKIEFAWELMQHEL